MKILASIHAWNLQCFFFYRGIELVSSTEIFFLVPVQSSKLWYRDNTSSITLYLPMSIRKHTLYLTHNVSTMFTRQIILQQKPRQRLAKLIECTVYSY